VATAESENGSTKRSWSHAYEENLGFMPRDAASSDTRQELSVPRTSTHDSMSSVAAVETSSVQFQSAAPSGQAKMVRHRKNKAVPLVDVSVKRCTRSTALKEGYRVPHIVDLAPKPRKRSRKAVPATRGPSPAHDQDTSASGSATKGFSDSPIPVATLQRTGDRCTFSHC
jgi:hypothetical protein